jgi:septum formation protein
MNQKIILASASPRRRELLAQIGLEFEVKVSNKEEVYTSTKPQKIVEELALMKAENVAEGVELKNTIVIGADTIVVRDEEILGKPKNEDHAYEILLSLQGRAHEVYTGVAILSYNNAGEKEIINHAVETKVHVHEMSEEEIRAYIATGDPMDKAGAYGIQGSFAAYIDGIEGDYYNVVGLPVSYVYQCLKKY